MIVIGCRCGRQGLQCGDALIQRLKRETGTESCTVGGLIGRGLKEWWEWLRQQQFLKKMGYYQCTRWHNE